MKIVYVDPDMPGITRKKVRNGWGYWDPKGERIADRDEIDRLNKIALPPAYVEAWFCPSPHGHIQAIGYDARGRRQYRYHTEFRAAREADKYDRLAAFGKALPLLRAQVERDLAGLPTAQPTVVAAIVRLLDIGAIRVGNAAYARENKSFGATTLRTRHAQVRGSKLSLQYRAKSGVMRKLTVTDRGLLRVVRKVQDLPGQNLFQYLDGTGAPSAVGSHDVNAYIKEAMGGEFSAKHFRTWSGSVIALDYLLKSRPEKPKLTEVLTAVSATLGNTPTVARKSYIHPTILALAGKDAVCDIVVPRRTRWLDGDERALIALLDDNAEAVSQAA